MPLYDLVTGKHQLRTGEVVRPNDRNSVVELTEKQGEDFRYKFDPVPDGADVTPRNPGALEADAPLDFETFVTDGNAGDVRGKIRRGDADGALDGVSEAEMRYNDGRKTVTNAIEARREELGLASSDSGAGEDSASDGDDGGE